MDRKRTITTAQQIAAEIAQEMGYTEMRIREDRQKGIWGDELTKLLEKTYGECTKEIRWFKPDAPEDRIFGDNIEFSFRFSNPQICIDHRNIDGSLANVEFSDWSTKIFHEFKDELLHMEEKLGRKLTIKENCSLEERHPYNTGEYQPKEFQVYDGDEHHGMEFLNLILEKWNKAVNN